MPKMRISPDDVENLPDKDKDGYYTVEARISFDEETNEIMVEEVMGKKYKKERKMDERPALEILIGKDDA